MSSVVIAGNTSGSVTLDAPNVAGTTVLTLPATSGTVVTTATTTGISGSAISTGTVGVSVGGTGANTLTANNVILGNGTSAVQFVAPGTNGNLLTSNGTTWTSAAAPAGGVTSLNGQTGAITNTNFGDIGSYYIGFGAANTAYTVGSTIAGGSLLFVSVSGFPFGAFSVIIGGGGSIVDTITNISSAQKASAGVSGTWRCMTRGGNAPTSNNCQFHLWVRIS